MKIDELIKIYNANYPKNHIGRDDVLKAVSSLSKLGTGCKVVGDRYISTVPFELSSDQQVLLKLSEQVASAK